MEIAENIKAVFSKIDEAANKIGKKRDEIILVAVSKMHPVEKILEAKEHGLMIFGESRAQELLQKYEMIPDVTWHFIGHLQRNKVKYIIDKVALIQSLDSIELAQEIDKRAKKIGKKMPVLIEINIGKELSKSGIYEEEIDEFVKKVSEFENIILNGIMTIPPVTDDRNKTRDYFKRMRFLYERLKQINLPNHDIKFLSMGMTDDFDIAIEEGANIVRVGTGIFGRRM
ncbi:MAG: YggS family pyridoxal phosphate-dependent enzyme [Caloramator sp.]|nr:YggS family pyridoxal phosphate-dependent enzyme [Caloramator sp.]